MSFDHSSNCISIEHWLVQVLLYYWLVLPFRERKLRIFNTNLHSFQNLSLGFILKIFLKFHKFQPQYYSPAIMWNLLIINNVHLVFIVINAWLLHRAVFRVFNWVSKVIRICFGNALLRLAIGSKFRASFSCIEPEVEPKPAVTRWAFVHYALASTLWWSKKCSECSPKVTKMLG